MTLLNQLSYILIGFSYTFLLINKIYFGFAIILGIILLMISNRPLNLNFAFKAKKVNFFFYLTISLFSISTLISILIDRSIPVLIYLTIFILLGLNIFFILKKKNIDYQMIEKFLVISIIINVLTIFIYNFWNYQISAFEVKKFKGILNIITPLVLLLPFFNKKKVNYAFILILFPALFYGNSNAPFLGILFGLIICLLFFLSSRLKLSNKFIFTIFLTISPIILYKASNILPNKFDENSIKNQTFEIPVKLVDAHRQFIWGFSLEKFKERPFLGYGPDTSNFLEGSQKKIGHPQTGTMPFIPSHPHNFLIELLLDVGIIGALSFILFIFFLNLEIYKISTNYQKYFLLFFNAYFWGASFVNFSFWLGWWQGSYFFILSIMATKIYIENKEIKPSD